MDTNQVGQLVGAAVSLAQDASAQAHKSGWKTSEFWLHILGWVPTVLGIAVGVSNPVTLAAGAVIGLSSSIYGATRGNVKATGLEVAAQAVQAASDAIKAATPAAQ